MTIRDRENEIKLHLLESLAASQRAVSTMLGLYAQLPEQSVELSRQVLRNLDMITRCQAVLAEKIGGIHLRRVISGHPGRPWLSAAIRSPRQH